MDETYSTHVRIKKLLQNLEERRQLSNIVVHVIMKCYNEEGCNCVE